MNSNETGYSNYFMKEIENKYLGRNPFKKMINRWKHRKFINKIRSWSPSVGVLWFFADFIKIAERVYFFNNKNGGPLFSSNSYRYGENGFSIISDHDKVKINCKLYIDDQKVAIEIKRLNGSNMITEHTFQNNTWHYDKDNYDEVLIDNVIGIINKSIIDLVEYCWDRKGSFDYGITENEKKELRKKN